MTKTQKSALCNFLRTFVKKFSDMNIDDMFEKFLDDEKYYLKINNPRFEFLKNYLDDDKFREDTMLFIKECKKYYNYKKQQEPLIQAQRAYEKKTREFLRELKMSKEKPTLKQL